MKFYDFINEKNEVLDLYKYFFELMKNEGKMSYSSTPIKKDDRSPNKYTIRVDIGNDPLKYFSGMKKTLSSKLVYRPSSVSISGLYDGFEIEYEKNVYYIINVNAKNGKSVALFKTKDLTPDAIGLGGKSLTKREIKKYVTAWLLSSKFDRTAVHKLIKVIDLCYDSPKDVVSLPDLNFSTKDLKTISKDFGEILAGFWLINNQEFREIEFPAGSNFPLVDLFGSHPAHHHL